MSNKKRCIGWLVLLVAWEVWMFFITPNVAASSRVLFMSVAGLMGGILGLCAGLALGGYSNKPRD